MFKGDFFKITDVGHDFAAQCHDRYIIIDNLDEKGVPVVEHRDEIFNAVYTYNTVVVRGTLHMIINGLEVDVKSGEFISITPCVNVEILDSNCLYFCTLTLNHVITDIYDRCGVGQDIKVRSFTFYHYSLRNNLVDELVKNYKILKREYNRPDYSQKEASIRALTCALIMKFYIFKSDAILIKHFDENSRQQHFFTRFLEFLSIYCRHERSVQFYADKLRITPKYLSNITNAFTRHSASVVIDHYVIFNIQQTLYENEFNIKNVSEMYHFPSQSFFGRYFKRITGMSPNAYVKMINKE